MQLSAKNTAGILSIASLFHMTSCSSPELNPADPEEFLGTYTAENCPRIEVSVKKISGENFILEGSFVEIRDDVIFQSETALVSKFEGGNCYFRVVQKPRFHDFEIAAGQPRMRIFSESGERQIWFSKQ